MKILIVGDVHWSQYSSIIRTKGNIFSTRLENLINSVNWAEECSKNGKCEYTIYLGDFFDKSEINSEEISALGEINWNKDTKHIFLCGNHEMGDKFHHSSSLKLFSLVPNCEVIDKPTLRYDDENCYLIFLPYMLEENRINLDNFCKGFESKKKYIFSHNDLQIQYGQYKSVNGFTIEEIENNCTKFFNGHLHNRKIISDKIENVGNITGQNFSENANKHTHGVVVLDTLTNSEKFIENPYAFNFYKIDNTNITLKNNAVVSATCYENDYDDMKKFLDSHALIYRIQVKRIISNILTEHKNEINKIDHISKFKKYVLDNIGNDDLIKSELELIL